MYLVEITAQVMCTCILVWQPMFYHLGLLAGLLVLAVKDYLSFSRYYLLRLTQPAGLVSVGCPVGIWCHVCAGFVVWFAI